MSKLFNLVVSLLYTSSLLAKFSFDFTFNFTAHFRFWDVFVGAVVIHGKGEGEEKSGLNVMD